MRQQSIFPSSIFLLHPANKGFLTGESKRLIYQTLGERIVFYVAFLFMVGLVIYFVILLSRDWQVITALKERGTTTEATIIAHRRESYLKYFSQLNYEYFISYRFWVQRLNRPDMEIIQEQQVTETTYGLPNGSPIAVRYLPENPSVSQYMSDIMPENNRLIGILILAGMTIFILLLQLWRYSRNHRLAMEGVIQTGHIIKAKGFSQKGIYWVKIHYCFQSPYGAELEGHDRYPRNDLRKKGALPVEGTPVAIVYVDDQLFKIL